MEPDRAGENRRANVAAAVMVTALAIAALVAFLLSGCGGLVFHKSIDGITIASGYLINQNVTAEWSETTLAPTALDDSVNLGRTETPEGTTTSLIKEAGEGRKLNFFDSAVGGIIGLLAGLFIAGG